MRPRKAIPVRNAILMLKSFEVDNAVLVFLITAQGDVLAPDDEAHLLANGRRVNPMAVVPKVRHSSTYRVVVEKGQLSVVGIPHEATEIDCTSFEASSEAASKADV